MSSIIGVLMDTFELEAQQARCVLNVVKDSDMKFTPKKGMRTLGGLANHLAQIPHLDPSIYDGEIASIDEARASETDLNRDTITEILTVFDEGVAAMKKRFVKMTEKTFFAKELLAFYDQGEPRSWANHLPDIITHIAMHKMQLWMYLKLAGYPVNMMTYYGHHSE
ncbi:MAG: hypothetical protein Q6361_01290 [Candidatus Hermodarchaeota archaeon]|nr:hypothetical protein [Candidatus Hermodarchaeota archaeon]